MATEAELKAWAKDLEEREKELSKGSKALDKQKEGLEKWEGNLAKKEGKLGDWESQLQEQKEEATAANYKRAKDPATSMPCPTCAEPAALSDGDKKTTISICANKHKHIHGAGLRKKLADQAKVVARAAVRSFPCPTCNQVASVENDPDSRSGTAISECAAGHRHVLSNQRRKGLGIAVG